MNGGNLRTTEFLFSHGASRLALFRWWSEIGEGEDSGGSATFFGENECNHACAWVVEPGGFAERVAALVAGNYEGEIHGVVRATVCRRFYDSS